MSAIYLCRDNHTIGCKLSGDPELDAEMLRERHQPYDSIMVDRYVGGLRFFHSHGDGPEQMIAEYQEFLDGAVTEDSLVAKTLGL